MRVRKLKLMPLKLLKLDSWPTITMVLLQATTMDPLQATTMDPPHQAIALILQVIQVRQMMHTLPVVPLLVQLLILHLAAAAVEKRRAVQKDVE
jgi:hypothetical protein